MEFGSYNVSLLVCVGMFSVVYFIGCRECCKYGKRETNGFTLH